MLVITRRMNEKITFPSLGITIHILRLTGATTRVGVEAPPEIQVFRDEICPAHGPALGPTGSPPVKTDREKADHALANALNKITLAVHLARRQWETGCAADADRTLESSLQAIEALARTRAAPTAAAPERRGRALLVDDDANERELLAGWLGMSGCECATAADGEDALAYLEAGGQPDVVLLDMTMPRCDGPETLRRIRADERFARLPVFSVSSTNPKELNVPDGPNGFDKWFPKPLNPRGLWDAIRTVVHSASAN